MKLSQPKKKSLSKSTKRVTFLPPPNVCTFEKPKILPIHLPANCELQKRMLHCAVCLTPTCTLSQYENFIRDTYEQPSKVLAKQRQLDLYAKKLMEELKVNSPSNVHAQLKFAKSEDFNLKPINNNNNNNNTRPTHKRIIEIKHSSNKTPKSYHPKCALHNRNSRFSKSSARRRNK